MKQFKQSRLWLYITVFIGIIIILTITFDALSFLYRPAVLVPISYSAYTILKIACIPITFSGPSGSLGFCDYILPDSVLQVTFGCTGIYALFILIAGIIAFPCSLRMKGTGIVLSIPLFYAYSILRLVFIGIVGHSFPAALDYFHSYVMEIINVVFILLVYIVWIRYVEKSSKAV